MRALRLAVSLALSVPLTLLAGTGTASADTATWTTLHSATFSGSYTTDSTQINKATTCYDAGVNSGGTKTCAAWFKTPNDYQHMCLANPATPATTGYWAPYGGDLSKQIGVDLYWTGGGVLEGTVIVPGTAAAYTMHVQLVDACGDMPATVDDTLNSTSIGAGFNLGGLAAGFYQFTGYVDAV